jgi:hypothetical protein
VFGVKDSTSSGVFGYKWEVDVDQRMSLKGKNRIKIKTQQNLEF